MLPEIPMLACCRPTVYDGNQTGVFVHAYYCTKAPRFQLSKEEWAKIRPAIERQGKEVSA